MIEIDAVNGRPLLTRSTFDGAGNGEIL